MDSEFFKNPTLENAMAFLREMKIPIPFESLQCENEINPKKKIKKKQRKIKKKNKKSKKSKKIQQTD